MSHRAVDTIAEIKAPRGVVYVATGERFVAEAADSVGTVRKIMPDLPIAMFTDVEVADGIFDFVFPVYEPQRAFIDKIEPLTRSPFERTLFLDTDTFVIQPCYDLFDILDEFDLAASHEPGRLQYPINMVPDAFVEFNTGVIAYRRNEKVDRFLRTWRRFYARDWERNLKEGKRPYDQISFTQVLYRSALRFFVLSPEYNFRTVFPQSPAGKVRVVHGRDFSKRDFAALNSSSAPRLFCPNPKDWLRGLKSSWGAMYNRIRSR